MKDFSFLCRLGSAIVRVGVIATCVLPMHLQLNVKELKLSLKGRLQLVADMHVVDNTQISSTLAWFPLLLMDNQSIISFCHKR